MVNRILIIISKPQFQAASSCIGLLTIVGEFRASFEYSRYRSFLKIPTNQIWLHKFPQGIGFSGNFVHIPVRVPRCWSSSKVSARNTEVSIKPSPWTWCGFDSESRHWRRISFRNSIPYKQRLKWTSYLRGCFWDIPAFRFLHWLGLKIPGIWNEWKKYTKILNNQTENGISG